MKAKKRTKNRKNGRWIRNIRQEENAKYLKKLNLDFLDCHNLLGRIVTNAREQGDVFTGKQLALRVLLPASENIAARTIPELEKQLRQFKECLRIMIKAENKKVAYFAKYSEDMHNKIMYLKRYKEKDPELGKKKLDFMFQAGYALKKFREDQLKKQSKKENLQRIMTDVG